MTMLCIKIIKYRYFKVNDLNELKKDQVEQIMIPAFARLINTCYLFCLLWNIIVIYT